MVSAELMMMMSGRFVWEWARRRFRTDLSLSLLLRALWRAEGLAPIPRSRTHTYKNLLRYNLNLRPTGRVSDADAHG